MTVKFFLNPFYLTDNYSPEAIQLAYGLRELGHAVISNIDYWSTEHGYLFTRDDNKIYDVSIMDHRFAYHTKPWVVQNHIDGDRLKQSFKVLLDRQCGQELNPQWNRDGWLSFFDLVCATDRTVYHPYNEKIIPWQIGLIPEVAREIERTQLGHRVESLLYNFRVGHNLRSLVVSSIKSSNPSLPFENIVDDFDPNQQPLATRVLNEQTGKRFNPAYFERINAHKAFLAVGGYLVGKPISYHTIDANGDVSVSFRARLNGLLFRTLANISGKHTGNAYKAIIQWDSFRLWESMYATTIPILLDFEYWGLALPILPQNGVHYLGINDLSSLDFLESLENMSNQRLEEIAVNGREWFGAHYSCVALADRLLNEIHKRNAAHCE